VNLQEVLNPIFSQRSATPTTVGSGGFFSLFGATTKNGVAVTEKSALTLSAFYNAIEIITNDYAKLPKGVFKKTDAGREKISHNIQYLISKRPNQYMNAYMFNKLMLLNAILKGNGYAYIERNAYTSKPTAIQLIDQDQTPVEVLKHNSKLYYRYGGNTIASEDIIHVPGFSFNGITGISIIHHAAKSLGVSLSTQEYSEDYYNTKGVGTAVVTTPKEMDPEAKKRYGEALGGTLDRNGNWKVAIVDEGGQFQHLKITPQEAQFIESGKFGVEEVARWLNMPLYKLKDTSNVNNSITENLKIEYVNDSILPWAIKTDLEYEIKLFSEAEKKQGLYIKSNEAALLRADKKTQAEYFSKLANAMIMKPAEAREKLDLPYLAEADVLLQPVNTQTKQQFDAKLEVSKSKNTANEKE